MQSLAKAIARYDTLSQYDRALADAYSRFCNADIALRRARRNGTNTESFELDLLAAKAAYDAVVDELRAFITGPRWAA